MEASIKLENRLCLICQDLVPISDNDSKPEYYQQQDKFVFYGSEDICELNRQLWSVLIAKKLLHLKSEHFVELLQVEGHTTKRDKAQNYLNPSEWFMFCVNCSKTVADVWMIYKEILKLEEELAKLAKRVQDQIKQNVTDELNSENYTKINRSNGYTEIENRIRHIVHTPEVKIKDESRCADKAYMQNSPTSQVDTFFHETYEEMPSCYKMEHNSIKIKQENFEAILPILNKENERKAENDVLDFDPIMCKLNIFDEHNTVCQPKNHEINQEFSLATYAISENIFAECNDEDAKEGLSKTETEIQVQYKKEMLFGDLNTPLPNPEFDKNTEENNWEFPSPWSICSTLDQLHTELETNNAVDICWICGYDVKDEADSIEQHVKAHHTENIPTPNSSEEPEYNNDTIGEPTHTMEIDASDKQLVLYDPVISDQNNYQQYCNSSPNNALMSKTVDYEKDEHKKQCQLCKKYFSIVSPFQSHLGQCNRKWTLLKRNKRKNKRRRENTPTTENVQTDLVSKPIKLEQIKYEIPENNQLISSDTSEEDKPPGFTVRCRSDGFPACFQNTDIKALEWPNQKNYTLDNYTGWKMQGGNTATSTCSGNLMLTFTPEIQNCAEAAIATHGGKRSQLYSQQSLTSTKVISQSLQKPNQPSTSRNDIATSSEIQSGVYVPANSNFNESSS